MAMEHDTKDENFKNILTVGNYVRTFIDIYRFLLNIKKQIELLWFWMNELL